MSVTKGKSIASIYAEMKTQKSLVEEVENKEDEVIEEKAKDKKSEPEDEDEDDEDEDSDESCDEETTTEEETEVSEAVGKTDKDGYTRLEKHQNNRQNREAYGRIKEPDTEEKERSNKLKKWARNDAWHKSRSVKEETEQLDELSKKTLGSYINKAKNNSDMSSFRSGKLYGKELATKRKPKADREQAKKENHNSLKREKGIAMAVKKLTKEETEVADNQEHIEETAAADTIKMHPTSFSSKASMMANVMGAMSAMTSDECCKWFEAAMGIANSKHMAQHTGGAEQKRQSVEMKGDPKKIKLASMKEDVEALFGSEELSEEFKAKTSVLFESAVNARVLAEVARLEEEYAETLEEEVTSIVESLVDEVDKYLDAAVADWMKENEVAIESSLKNELAESFILNLKEVFANHYCTFPDDQVDVVEALAEKVEALEEDLSKTMKEKMDLVEAIEQYTRDQLVEEVAQGLALTQKEKFATLVESVAFDGDEDAFKQALTVIKDHHFGVKAKPSLMNEEVEIEEPASETKYLDPAIAAYAQAIKKTVKR